MKRLTFDGEFCDISMCREELGGPFCEEGYCSQRRVWERLKSIEDTLGDEYDLSRLPGLVRALPDPAGAVAAGDVQHTIF